MTHYRLSSSPNRMFWIVSTLEFVLLVKLTTVIHPGRLLTVPLQAIRAPTTMALVSMPTACSERRRFLLMSQSASTLQTRMNQRNPLCHRRSTSSYTARRWYVLLLFCTVSHTNCNRPPALSTKHDSSNDSHAPLAHLGRYGSPLQDKRQERDPPAPISPGN